MASWRSLRSAVFSSVMSRANIDTDRGAPGPRSTEPVGRWATMRAETGTARPWRCPEGQLALPAPLGEHLGLDDLAVVLEAAGLEDVLEVGGAVDHPHPEHLAGRLVAVAQMAVGAGGQQEVRALLEDLGEPGGKRRRGAGGAELEDLEHQAVDAGVGAVRGGDVGPDRPAQPGHRGGRRRRAGTRRR